MEGIGSKSAGSNQGLGVPFKVWVDDDALIVRTPASDRVAKAQTRALKWEKPLNRAGTDDLRYEDVVSHRRHRRRELWPEEWAGELRHLLLQGGPARMKFRRERAAPDNRDFQCGPRYVEYRGMPVAAR